MACTYYAIILAQCCKIVRLPSCLLAGLFLAQQVLPQYVFALRFTIQPNIDLVTACLLADDFSMDLPFGAFADNSEVRPVSTLQ